MVLHHCHTAHAHTQQRQNTDTHARYGTHTWLWCCPWTCKFVVTAKLQLSDAGDADAATR
jgi:hypothetical protein